jgi:MOSC domain-containing protein YiiM
VPHPGDTIVADLDTSIANLPEGTLLRAGSAVLRVSGLFNAGCAKWKVRYGAAAKDWIVAPGHPELRLRGVLCAVEEDGVVAVGDRIVKVRGDA